MSFLENIANSLGMEESLFPLPFRIMILGSKAGYFENIKSIKSYDKKEIRLAVKCGVIVVTGENLSIRKYCEGDVLVLGAINSVKVEDD